MKRSSFIFAALLLAALQFTVLDYARIFNVKPDLLLIPVFMAGLLFEARFALFFCILAGILKDLLLTNSFGINTLLFPVWCLFVMRLKREITLDNNLIRTAAVLIFAFLHNIATGLILLYMGNSIPLGVFLRITFVASIYTAFVFSLATGLIIPFSFKFQDR